MILHRFGATLLCLATLACFAPLAAAGDGAQPSGDSDPEERYAELAYFREVIAASAEQRDPRHVLAAALLARMLPLAERLAEDGASVEAAAAAGADPRLEEAAALFAAALAGAPDDPLVLWTVVLVAHEGTPGLSAMAEASLERLLVLDGDNAAVWIEWMHRHRDTVDATRQERALARAAAARRHALRYLDVARVLVDAMARVPLPPELAARAQDELGTGDPRAAHFQRALGVVFALAVPSLQTVTQACSGAALDAESRRRQCTRLGQLLAEQADTVLGESLGLSLWHRAADSAGERARVAERRRIAQWQTAAFAEWLQADEVAALRWADTGALWLDPALDERAVRARALEAAGIAPTPPQGWNLAVP